LGVEAEEKGSRVRASGTLLEESREISRQIKTQEETYLGVFPVPPRGRARGGIRRNEHRVELKRVWGQKEKKNNSKHKRRNNGRF